MRKSTGCGNWLGAVEVWKAKRICCLLWWLDSSPVALLSPFPCLHFLRLSRLLQNFRLWLPSRDKAPSLSYIIISTGRPNSPPLLFTSCNQTNSKNDQDLSFHSNPLSIRLRVSKGRGIYFTSACPFCPVALST